MISPGIYMRNMPAVSPAFYIFVAMTSRSRPRIPGGDNHYVEECLEDCFEMAASSIETDGYLFCLVPDFYTGPG